jgi:hypothetical protein
MVKFEEVDPNEIPNFREGHRGRVSYPILKSFLETGITVAKLDRTGMQQSLQSLNSSLGAYVRSHKLPIKLFTRGGEIYLMRLDTDDEGNPQLSASEAMSGAWETEKFSKGEGSGGKAGQEPRPITPEVVAERFEEAKDPTR